MAHWLWGIESMKKSILMFWLLISLNTFAGTSDEQVIDQTLTDVALDQLADTHDDKAQPLSEVEILERVLDDAFADELDWDTDVAEHPDVQLSPVDDVVQHTAKIVVKEIDTAESEVASRNALSRSKTSEPTLEDIMPEKVLNELDDSSLMDFVEEDDWVKDQLSVEPPFD